MLNYSLNKNTEILSSLDIWQQSTEMDFSEIDSDWGCALEFFIQHKILRLKISSQSIYFDLGVFDKSYAFMPAELFIDEHFQLRLGCTLGY